MYKTHMYKTHIIYQEGDIDPCFSTLCQAVAYSIDFCFTLLLKLTINCLLVLPKWQCSGL